MLNELSDLTLWLPLRTQRGRKGRKIQITAYSYQYTRVRRKWKATVLEVNDLPPSKLGGFLGIVKTSLID
jgi:hypothetical protein